MGFFVGQPGRFCCKVLYELAATARDQSVHYTPRTIARLLVDEVFAATQSPVDARVLDPACGAGIFLALAFRRLVRERWLRDKHRPTVHDIKQILYGQLRGFDVSESALRLAALTLYITAIELNGSPRPPKTLKFPRNLRGEVLFHMGEAPPSSGQREKPFATTTFSLGSLGDRVPARFDKHFDIVLGNPPWTRLRDEPTRTGEVASSQSTPSRTKTDELNDVFTEIGKRALRAHGLDSLATNYKNPDKNPDLPFMFRATEWAKEDGLIAMVLPARIFQRRPTLQGDPIAALLHLISITGIINGAELRKTAVWEGVDMPFCLLFARNVKPSPEHRFHYATPMYERGFNKSGRFRIDYGTAQVLTTQRIQQQRWLFKTLAFGTWLDVEVMETLLRAFPQTLAQFWQAWDTTLQKTGQGYNLSPGLPQNPDEFLVDMNDFEPPQAGFAIEHKRLRTFFENHARRTAHMPRREALYQPPLLLVPQSPGESAEGPRAYFSSKALAFKQSFYGYSCSGHPHAATLASLLYLLPHSKLFTYFCLMTSIRLGFDRQTFNKEDLDAIPFPDVATLSPEQRVYIEELARRLEQDREKPWPDIDRFVFELYGVDADSAQVVCDTLFSSAFFRESGREAFDPPTRDKTRTPFRNALREMLDPFFEVCGERVVVDEPAFEQDEWRQPWFFLTISRQGEPVHVDVELLRRAMEEADRHSASRILVRMKGRQGLFLGLLNQRRYWTLTRARLCGQYILRNHLDAFNVPEGL